MNENGMMMLYLIVGIIMALYWWETEFKAEYDTYKKMGIPTDDSMLIIVLAIYMIFWPLKLTMSALYSLFGWFKRFL